MSQESTDRVERVLQSGFIGQGAVVEQFEKELSEKAPYPVVAMNSCTSSIQAVLMLLGVGAGDEVITTPLTCVATNAPILAVGALPVWADVDAFGNIDPADVARKVTRRTRAIIAVNWTGRPANYEALRSFLVPVIEDAAHGPVIGKRPTGDFICYSFGPIKHLTCGDGGAVATACGYDREQLRLLRWYGLDRTSTQDFRCAQNIQQAGMKFHMTDINAAIGLGNLQYIDQIVRVHRSNARALHAGLMRAGLPWLMLPTFSEESNYWVFPILARAQVEREALKAHLESRGIAASQVHARNDKHRAYDFQSGPLPMLDAYDRFHLNLPCGWWVSLHDIDTIVTALKEFKPA